jgi:hypothetical protein
MTDNARVAFQCLHQAILPGRIDPRKYIRVLDDGSQRTIRRCSNSSPSNTRSVLRPTWLQMVRVTRCPSAVRILMVTPLRRRAATVGEPMDLARPEIHKPAQHQVAFVLNGQGLRSEMTTLSGAPLVNTCTNVCSLPKE